MVKKINRSNENYPRIKKIQWGVILRWAGTLTSTFLFLLLILRQKWDIVFLKASSISIWAILLAVLFYLVSYWFNTLRWIILLWAQGVEISIWRAYRLNWAGYFASNFLPSTIGGDGFRMLAVHPYTEKKSISIGSVALDRIINMAAMTCLLPAPLILFGSAIISIFRNPVSSSFTLVNFFSPARKLIEKYFPKIISAIDMWRSKPWSFFWAFMAAWPSNLIPIAATYVIARQLGLEVNYWQVMAVQTVTYFLSVLPISVNGYGLREVAYTTLYTSLGATVEQASTLALVTRLIMVLCTIPGAIWLTSVVTKNLTFDEKSNNNSQNGDV